VEGITFRPGKEIRDISEKQDEFYEKMTDFINLLKTAEMNRFIIFQELEKEQLENIPLIRIGGSFLERKLSDYITYRKVKIVLRDSFKKFRKSHYRLPQEQKKTNAKLMAILALATVVIGLIAAVINFLPKIFP
jgi:hypothetical protein